MLFSCFMLFFFVFIFYLAFQPFNFERTWCSLFQKCIVHTKFDIYVFITVIIDSHQNNTFRDSHQYNTFSFCINYLCFFSLFTVDNRQSSQSSHQYSTFSFCSGSNCYQTGTFHIFHRIVLFFNKYCNFSSKNITKLK